MTVGPVDRVKLMVENPLFCGHFDINNKTKAEKLAAVIYLAFRILNEQLDFQIIPLFGGVSDTPAI